MATVKKTIKKKKTEKKNGRTGLALISILAVVFASFFYTLFLRPATNFKGEEVVILIPSNKANKNFVKNKIKSSIKSVQYSSFLGLAEWFDMIPISKPFC